MIILGRQAKLDGLNHLGPLIDASKVDALQILQDLPIGELNKSQRLKWPFTEDKTAKMIAAFSARLGAIQVAVELEDFRISEQTWAVIEELRRDLTSWTVKQNDMARSTQPSP